jgi:hypothetical protein
MLCRLFYWKAKRACSREPDNEKDATRAARWTALSKDLAGVFGSPQVIQRIFRAKRGKSNPVHTVSARVSEENRFLNVMQIARFLRNNAANASWARVAENWLIHAFHLIPLGSQ